jgi:hypothetical protein
MLGWRSGRRQHCWGFVIEVAGCYALCATTANRLCVVCAVTVERVLCGDSGARCSAVTVERGAAVMVQWSGVLCSDGSAGLLKVDLEDTWWGVAGLSCGA